MCNVCARHGDPIKIAVACNVRWPSHWKWTMNRWTVNSNKCVATFRIWLGLCRGHVLGMNFERMWPSIGHRWLHFYRVAFLCDCGSGCVSMCLCCVLLFLFFTCRTAYDVRRSTVVRYGNRTCTVRISHHNHYKCHNITKHCSFVAAWWKFKSYLFELNAFNVQRKFENSSHVDETRIFRASVKSDTFG